MARSNSDEPGLGLAPGRAGAATLGVARVGSPSKVNDSALEGCLDRLEALLAEEHRALNDMAADDLRLINARKSALLLELDRGQRANKAGTIEPMIAERLREVRRKLEVNMRDISLHLAALNEVLSVVRRSVERSEADGTYSRTAQLDEWIK